MNRECWVVFYEFNNSISCRWEKQQCSFDDLGSAQRWIELAHPMVIRNVSDPIRVKEGE